MSSLACCGGFIDKGQPTGTVVVVDDDIQCYIAESAEPTDTAVVVATDAFGFTLPNSRLIADSFAKQSFLAVVPDVFRGKESSPVVLDHFQVVTRSKNPFRVVWAFLQILYHFVPFLLRNKESTGVEIVKRTVQAVRRTRPEIKHVVLQGYCWGGTIGVTLAQRSDIVDAVCSAHPGGLNVSQAVPKIVQPIYFVLAGLDFQIKEKQVKQIQSIMQDKTDVKSVVKVYDGMHHGFAVRGNEDDPAVCANRVDAFESAVRFFKEVLNKTE